MKFPKLVIILPLLLITAFWVLPKFSFAQPCPATGCEPPDYNLSVERLLEIAQRLSCWTTRIAVALMVIVILWYGWQTMAGKDPDNLSKIKKAMTWAFVGVLVIIGAYVLINTVAVAVGITEAEINPIIAVISECP